jgi:hypothetical protein
MTLGSKIDSVQQRKTDALILDIEQRILRLEKCVADMKIRQRKSG